MREALDADFMNGDYSREFVESFFKRSTGSRPVDKALQLVPEISGHRLMALVRLMRFEADGRLRPSEADTTFELTLCA
jgi:hypothetical protein